MSTSVQPTSTTAPLFPNSYCPTKSPIIVYNRQDGETDVRYWPNIVNIAASSGKAGEYDRNAIVFDTVNRTVLRHCAGSSDDNIVSGHAYYGGVHNETFNDYTGNGALSVCSYSFVAGRGNRVEYNTTANSSGGAAFGHYNNPGASYLFTVGNGLSDNNRSNILSITDESIIFGYGPLADSKKYVTVTNGNVVIDGDLTVSGDINGASGGSSGGASSEELENLKTQVEAMQTKLAELEESLAALYGASVIIS